MITLNYFVFFNKSRVVSIIVYTGDRLESVKVWPALLHCKMSYHRYFFISILIVIRILAFCE